MGRGLPTLLYVPTQSNLMTRGLESKKSGERVGWGVSHKGVLVINGSGMTPFFSVAP